MKREEKACFILLMIAFVGAIYVGLPLIEAIAFGIALAYVVRPVAYKIRPSLGPTFSSFLSLGVALFVLFVFTVYSFGSLLIEANSFVNNNQHEAVLAPINHYLQENPQAKEYLEVGMQSAITYLSSQLEDIGPVISNMLGVLNFVVTIFMSLIIAFYLLKDGPNLKKAVFELVPPRYNRLIDLTFERIDKDLQTMFVGSLFTAIFVWIVTSLLLIILGVPYAMLLGMLSGFLQLVPMVGPQIVLIPLGLILIASGSIIQGIIVLILSGFFFFLSDLVVRSVLSKNTKTVHPLIVLIAFIGGVLAFGLKGVVLGPIIFASLDGLMKAHRELSS
ncbi:AI-2E family transporter [archaeon]|nr:AI-2E family transporter [archaeon]